jgi:hypothetical protein
MRIFLLAALFSFLPSHMQKVEIPPGPAKIKVTSSLVSKRVLRDGTVLRVYRVFNRPAYRNSIGLDIQLCLPVYQKVISCREFYQLNRGQIIAVGLVTDLDFNRLAITGGIGYYDNVTGSVLRSKIGRDTFSIVMQLNGA